MTRIERIKTDFLKSAEIRRISVIRVLFHQQQKRFSKKRFSILPLKPSAGKTPTSINHI